MLSLHKLFLNDGSPESFDRRIAPTDAQRKALILAKNTIRDHLLKDIQAATTTILGMERAVKPKFRSQGSWVYGTCIQGAHQPPQQMDWDFGVYLPVTAWSENAPPRAMAKLYFDLVETSLKRLCGEHGWYLDPKTERCVRVHIASWAHIDIPLYAAPEEKFVEVMEKALASATNQVHYLREAAALDESVDFGEMPEQFWELMEDIHVARRDGTWTPSDPEDVAKWFEDRILEQGEGGLQLRRLCRYFKAWRDYHWRDGGGPSSVLIMIIVARNFSYAPRREDLALESAAAHLARELGGDVVELGIGKENFNRMDAADRRLASERATTLHRELDKSRHYGPGLRQAAVDNMRAQFGARIANDPALVLNDDSGVVRSTEAKKVAAPFVGASHSG